MTIEEEVRYLRGRVAALEKEKNDACEGNARHARRIEILHTVVLAIAESEGTWIRGQRSSVGYFRELCQDALRRDSAVRGEPADRPSWNGALSFEDRLSGKSPQGL